MMTRLILSALALMCFVVPSPAATTKPVSPEIEKILVEFRERCIPEKQKQLSKHMQDTIEAIDAKARLTAEEKTALEAKSKSLVEAAVEAWKPRFLEALCPYLSDIAEKKRAAYVKAWKPDNAGPNEPVENWTIPDDLPDWSETLKTVLGPERFAVWEKEHEGVLKERNKKIADYLKVWADKGRQPLERDIKLQIEDMKTAMKLDDAKVDALKDAAKEAVDRIVQSEIPRATALFRNMTEATRKNMMGRNYYYVRFVIPNGADNEPGWKAATKALLSSEQQAAWVAWRKEQQKAIEADVAKSVQALGEQYREGFLQMLTTDAASIAALVGLPEDRAKALDKAAEGALNTFIESYQKKLSDKLLKGTASYREDVFRQRIGVSLDLPGEENPLLIPAWVKVKETLLTAEERKRLDAALKDRAARIARSTASLFIAEMDGHVAFNSEQRARLEPVIAKFTLTQQELSQQEDDWDMRVNMNGRGVLGIGVKLKEADVKPLMNADQWKRWQQTITTNEPFQNGRRNVPEKPKTDDTKKELPSVEAAVSVHLHTLRERERKRVFADMQVNIEEASRIGSLPPASVARLETAAKGVTEKLLQPWLENMSRYTRSQVQDATPQSVQQRLAAMGNVSFGNSRKGPQETTLWSGTVEKVLSESAREAWKKEKQERATYRSHAIAGTVIANIHRTTPLNEQQEASLEPLLTAMINEYSVDMDNWFSQPWYLSSYSLMLPLAGVPQKDLARIFPPDQLKRIKETLLPQAEQYWTNLQEMHKNRVGRNADQTMIIQTDGIDVDQ